MLLRFAKIVGGLRLLVAEAAPIVATSVGLLSARSAAYLVGFALGSIVSGWLPIVALLVSITGAFNILTNTATCDAYRAEMRRIDDLNRATLASWRVTYDAYVAGPYAAYISAAKALADSARSQAQSLCAGLPLSQPCVVCGGGGIQGISCVSTFCSPRYECEGREFNRLNVGLTFPSPPPQPVLISYPSCSSPDCPAGKKTWVQVIWASRAGNFSDSKGCFLVAFSQDAPTVPPKIEYNPFLPSSFVLSRAVNYYLIRGDRFRGVNSSTWQNLESVSGWDRGYWQAESVDSECRGWRPGWSIKVK